MKIDGDYYHQAKTVLMAVLVVLATLVARAPLAHAEDQVIGFVKTLSGSAMLTREKTVEQVHAGMPLRQKDTIETGADGRLGITFRDDTRIALGPGSRIELVKFVFKPADKEYGFVLRLVQGTLEYISGIMAKLAPEAITIETPTATVGVRGTRFLARAGD
jgi:hypothetical protein